MAITFLGYLDEPEEMTSPKRRLLLRNRKELLIALRKGLSPAEAGLLGSIPSFGGSLSPGVIRPGLNIQEEEEDEKDDA